MESPRAVRGSRVGPCALGDEMPEYVELLQRAELGKVFGTEFFMLLPRTGVAGTLACDTETRRSVCSLDSV